MANEGYDIIGDVHGCADKLEQLLHTMDYAEVDGAWKHPARQAVFVGDFIDRGPRQLDSVAIPRAMVEAGSALAVIGNHEFNAASLATKDAAGEWNRAHSTRNLEQTSNFRDAAIFGSSTHQDIIDWFMSLPLWLDLDGLRVVHACWHEASMRLLDPLLSSEGSLTHDLLIEANIQHTPAFDAIEVVLKGPEASLDGYSYEDKDGHRRKHGRVRWWDPHGTTMRSGIRLADDWVLSDASGRHADQLPDTPLPEWLNGITPTDPNRSPVLFGHYWFEAGEDSEKLEVINTKAACVDFSAVKGGPLVAYRWSGEAELTSQNLAVSAPG
jgi:hypothetical protein